ncbi:MAG: hypothetical protein HOE90_20730 [Bacteriovoracaceae bacterium]|jgi:hypothetical protein|nr:hypothetical protein [Bacteriovoracaceae bacterium]
MEIDNFLVICPSNKWGTKEKAALRDIGVLSTSGKKVSFVCTKDSFLHLKSKKYKIDIIPCRYSVISKLFDTKFYYFIKEVVRNGNYSVIHTFDFYSLYPLSYLLKQRKSVALFFSFYGQSLPYRMGLIHKLFLGRVDQVVTLGEELPRKISRSVNLPERRIVGLGGGISVEKNKMLDGKRPYNSLILGGIVPADKEKVDFLVTLFDALLPMTSMVSKILPSKDFQLYLFSERPWRQRVIFEHLKNFLWEKGVEDMVHFKEIGMSCEEEAIIQCDIWIGLETNSCIAFDLLYGLCLEVPTLASRSPSTSSIAGKASPLLKTFAGGDSRELRSKFSEILSDFSKKKSKKASSEEIYSEHNLDKYSEDLMSIYSRALERRARAMRKGT